MNLSIIKETNRCYDYIQKNRLRIITSLDKQLASFIFHSRVIDADISYSLNESRQKQYYVIHLEYEGKVFPVIKVNLNKHIPANSYYWNFDSLDALKEETHKESYHELKLLFEKFNLERLCYRFQCQENLVSLLQG